MGSHLSLDTFFCGLFSSTWSYGFFTFYHRALLTSRKQPFFSVFHCTSHFYTSVLLDTSSSQEQGKEAKCEPAQHCLTRVPQGATWTKKTNLITTVCTGAEAGSQWKAHA